MKRTIPGPRFLCLFLMLPLLSGCWDQISVDNRAYVVAIGLDKGEDNNLIVTFLISNPEFSKQEGPTSEPSHEVITFPAIDFITAKNTANSVIAKQISYHMLITFIVSEKLAEDTNFIRYMYDVTKEREIKRNVAMIITKEDVNTFIKENKPQLETRVHKYYDFILENANKAGLIPNFKLHSFFAITEADADIFLTPYATTKKDNETKNKVGEDEFLAGQLNVDGHSNKTQFLGSAVFKEGKMIGKLNGEETRLTIMLNETLEMGEIYSSFPDPINPQYTISTRMMKYGKNTVKMDLNRYTPTIDVTIPLYLDILSIHSMETYNNGNIDLLRTNIEETIKKKMEKLVQKTQEDFKGEPFGWSLVARKHFWTRQDYENYDWMKSYPKMKVNIKVDVFIGTFGEQSELPKLHEVRD